METKTDTPKTKSTRREDETKIQVVRSFLEDLFGVFRDVVEPFSGLLRIMDTPEFEALLEAKLNGQKHHTRKRTNRNRSSSATNRGEKKEQRHKRMENCT